MTREQEQEPGQRRQDDEIRVLQALRQIDARLGGSTSLGRYSCVLAAQAGITPRRALAAMRRLVALGVAVETTPRGIRNPMFRESTLTVVGAA